MELLMLFVNIYTILRYSNKMNEKSLFYTLEIDQNKIDSNFKNTFLALIKVKVA